MAPTLKATDHDPKPWRRVETRVPFDMNRVNLDSRLHGNDGVG
jgi:hypothetical protein